MSDKETKPTKSNMKEMTDAIANTFAGCLMRVYKPGQMQMSINKSGVVTIRTTTKIQGEKGDSMQVVTAGVWMLVNIQELDK